VANTLVYAWRPQGLDDYHLDRGEEKKGEKPELTLFRVINAMRGGQGASSREKGGTRARSAPSRGTREKEGENLPGRRRGVSTRECPR